MNAPMRFAAAVALVLTLAGAEAEEVDSESGLIMDAHWETVKAHCTVCHSARLITMQGASRETWEEIIRWMQTTQGLWAFDEKTEGNILDYLAANYPPTGGYRRKPLSPLLMPKNPYE